MLNAESRNNHIDQGNGEDQHQNHIVQNDCRTLVLRSINVERTNDDVQQADHQLETHIKIHEIDNNATNSIVGMNNNKQFGDSVL